MVKSEDLCKLIRKEVGLKQADPNEAVGYFSRQDLLILYAYIMRAKLTDIVTASESSDVS
jgi:hypothetical protein